MRIMDGSSDLSSAHHLAIHPRNTASFVAEPGDFGSELVLRDFSGSGHRQSLSENRHCRKSTRQSRCAVVPGPGTREKLMELFGPQRTQREQRKSAKNLNGSNRGADWFAVLHMDVQVQIGRAHV